MNPYLLRIALFLFGSGFCALVYQLAWLRLLRLVFGSSTAASAAVLAIFMGGLGLGGYLLGRRAERSASPLGFYANLEIGISLSAALSVLLIPGVRALYIAAGGSAALGPAFGTAMRLALATLVLALPTFLMGGTLPAMVRAATRAADTARHTVGVLYALNTLGAVAGAMVTTFWLIELVGIRQTIWLACLLNLLVAMAARATARRQGAIESPAAATPAAAAAAGTPRGLFRLVLFAAAVVGFVFFVMELVWYRMMGPILGGSTYTFGIILAVALLGIGIGGLIYGLVSPGRRATPVHFAVTCALEALAVAIPLALGDRVAYAALELRDLQGAGFSYLVLSWTVVSSFVVLPAALVAGYQFPLLVALLGSGRERVAREVGLAYAWNTAGAIAGSIAGGFWLIPLLSAPASWRLSVWLLAALAGLFLLADPRRGRLQRLAPATIALAALLLTLASGPSAFWRHGGIGAGREESSPESPNELRELVSSRRRSVLWETDGLESSVALVRLGGYAFMVNGKSDGSARADAPTQVFSPLIAAALHPAPKTALVIGLGTGSSAGWLASVDTMERVDVAELEPAIRRVADDCVPVNRGALQRDNVNLVIADGRELLLTSRRRYDVIFSEPSNPYRAGIASLFTREFYEAAARGLGEDGIFVQWLQGYEVDARVVRTAYATIGAVFPHVETWQVHRRDLLLVAASRPIRHDLERVRRRVESEPVRTAMQAVWGVSGLEGFYTGYLASPGFATAVREQEGGEINTDDHPIIEFGFARHVGRKGLFQLSELRQLAELRGESRPQTLAGELDWERVGELREARGLLIEEPIAPARGQTLARRARARARTAYLGGDLRAAYLQWTAQKTAPEARGDLALVAESMAEAGDERAVEIARRLGELQPIEELAVLARWHLRDERVAEATTALVAAFDGYRRDPWPAPRLMQRALLLADEIARRDRAAGRRLYAQLGQPFAVRVLDEARLLSRVNIARRVDFARLCAEAFAAFEPHVPWNGTFLRQRRDCYAGSGHPLAAVAAHEYGEFNALGELPMWWGLLPERSVETDPLELPETGGGARDL